MGGGHSFERKVIIDGLYKTLRNESVRILLEYKYNVWSKDSTYDLAIYCLSPDWEFKETPSLYRNKHEILTRHR